MPARPFRMPDSVLRLTPSARAVSVTVRFNGFRHNTLSTSPGCGGLCIFIVTSVVILVVYVIYVLAGTGECDEEPFDSLVPESRHADQCNLCGYGLQSAWRSTKANSCWLPD